MNDKQTIELLRQSVKARIQERNDIHALLVIERRTTARLKREIAKLKGKV